MSQPAREARCRRQIRNAPTVQTETAAADRACAEYSLIESRGRPYLRFVGEIEALRRDAYDRDRLAVHTDSSAEGASAVAPYSTRNRPGPSCAVPLAWDEHPFEWERPRRFSVYRRFYGPILRDFTSCASLTPQAGGTLLRYEVTVRPASVLGLLAIPIQIGLISRRRFERAPGPGRSADIGSSLGEPEDLSMAGRGARESLSRMGWGDACGPWWEAGEGVMSDCSPRCYGAKPPRGHGSESWSGDGPVPANPPAGWVIV